MSISSAFLCASASREEILSARSRSVGDGVVWSSFKLCREMPTLLCSNYLFNCLFMQTINISKRSGDHFAFYLVLTRLFYRAFDDHHLLFAADFYLIFCSSLALARFRRDTTEPIAAFFSYTKYFNFTNLFISACRSLFSTS